MTSPASWMTKREAASWLGCSLTTISRLLAADQVEFVKLRRRVRIRPEALEEYVERCTFPTSEGGQAPTWPSVRVPGVDGAGRGET